MESSFVAITFLGQQLEGSLLRKMKWVFIWIQSLLRWPTLERKVYTCEEYWKPVLLKLQCAYKLPSPSPVMLKIQILASRAGRTWDSAFLTSSQLILLLLVWGPHFGQKAIEQKGFFCHWHCPKFLSFPWNSLTLLLSLKIPQILLFWKKLQIESHLSIKFQSDG